MAQYSTCFYPLCGGGSNGEAKGSLFFLHKLFSMSTGAVFHERTLHGGFEPQKRIEMLVLGSLLVCSLARSTTLTHSLACALHCVHPISPKLEKRCDFDVTQNILNHSAFHTCVLQTDESTDEQTDGQTLFQMRLQVPKKPKTSFENTVTHSSSACTRKKIMRFRFFNDFFRFPPLSGAIDFVSLSYRKL